MLAKNFAEFDETKCSFQDHMWNSWNASQPGALQQAGIAFMEALVFIRSRFAVASAPETIRHVLQRLCALFGAHCAAKDGALIESGFVRSENTRQLRGEILSLCSKIRPDALMLIDG